MEYPYRNQQYVILRVAFSPITQSTNNKEHSLQDIVLISEEGDGPLILPTERGSIGEEVEDRLEQDDFLTVGEDFYGCLEGQDFAVDLVRDTL